MTETQGGDIALVVRRTIAAPRERLFAAWTDPEQLKAWWGPGEVVCLEAQVDLRVGGAFAIANQHPGGDIIWITGEYLAVEPPSRLVYTWLMGDPATATETRVTVRFEPRDEGTEVIVVHEHFATEQSRDLHAQGWEGCLEGLAAHMGPSGTS